MIDRCRNPGGESLQWSWEEGGGRLGLVLWVTWYVPGCCRRLVLRHGLCRLFDTRLEEGGGKDEYFWTESTCKHWPKVVICASTSGDFEPLLAIDRVALDN